MNLSKAIDLEISKSSLVGLKAELLKKQEEVKKIKELQQNSFKPVLKPRKNTETRKSNKGVESRCLRNTESLEDDVDIHKKSREILEAKSRLYDKLKENCLESDSKSQYLTDFNLKHEIYEKKESAEEIQEDEEGHYSDSNSDPENDWVDFVDALGRTRRCLRKDLEEMKTKDSKLAQSLRPPTPPAVPEPTPELMSWDMQREQMRKKWEEQETVLLGKTEIHYQDVLFDEARPHGVGYFEFSIDENERLRQQQALKNLRNETVEQQQAAEGLRARRQQQLQARLAAAQRRRRVRLGLPPEEPQPQETEEVTVSNTVEEANPKEDVKDLEESIKRKMVVRPWDIGKQTIDCVMSQEEWIEKKRLERPEEFAPPVSHLEVAEDNKPFTFKKKFNEMTKGTKSNNTKKFTQRLDKLENIIPTRSSGSYVEDIKDHSCQYDNTFHSTQSKISDTQARSWKKTSDEIDAFLSQVRASYRNPVVQDYKNCSSNSENSSLKNESGTECIDSTDFNIRNETKLQNTFNDVEASNLLKTNKRQSNITADEFSMAADESNQYIKRKRAEVPPPTSMSYYTNNIVRKQSNPESNPHLADSICAGFDYLKTQTEKKEKKRIKGLLDVI